MRLVKLVEKSGRSVEEFELRRSEDGERIGDNETIDIVGFFQVPSWIKGSLIYSGYFEEKLIIYLLTYLEAN